MGPRPDGWLREAGTEKARLREGLLRVMVQEGSTGLELLDAVGLNPSVLESLAQGMRTSTLEVRRRSGRRFASWLEEAGGLVWTGCSVPPDDAELYRSEDGFWPPDAEYEAFFHQVNLDYWNMGYADGSEGGWECSAVGWRWYADEQGQSPPALEPRVELAVLPLPEEVRRCLERLSRSGLQRDVRGDEEA
jgi:hypothetical protein